MTEFHTRNNNCDACCCKGTFVHKNCGGNMHERVVDDTMEEGWIHNYKCDKCDTEEYQYGYEDMTIEFKQ